MSSVTQKISEGIRLCLRLKEWGRLGEALAYQDGQPVFVFGGIPGEEVEVEVLRRRRRYLAARVVRVLEPSPYRVEPPCPYFGQCTGCQWQHVDYAHTLELKRQAVGDALARVGDFACPPVDQTLAAPSEYGYRNHARFTVGPRGSLGFVNRESRRFVPIDRCLLMNDGINETLGRLQGRCAETTQLSVRYGSDSGDFLIQPPMKGQEIPLPTGQKHYLERLDGREFRVASPSFFQVNIPQAGRMVDLIRRTLGLSGREFIIDAYAGVGTFAVLLAPRCRRVIAIEESSAAVEDGRANAAGLENLEFRQARTEDALEELDEQPDGVVLDPPRAGCHPRVLRALSRLRPQRIAYVSCEPAALGRDLKLLCADGFRLERVEPIDMFPQTHHVECVATLIRRDRLYPKTVILRSPDFVGATKNLGGGDREQTLLRQGRRDRSGDGEAQTSQLVLASSSPRRWELMSSMGLEFQMEPPEVSEEPAAGEEPQEMVERLALDKARSVADSRGQGLIIGADSVVVIDGLILGKPSNEVEARETLTALRGRTHRVFSGVAVVDASTGRWQAASRATEVTMRDYTDQEVVDYIASGSPMDKAGAYGVQDAFQPAGHVDGCYSNVVGLPLCLLAGLLKEMGYLEALQAPPHLIEGCTGCPLAEVVS